MWRSGPIREIRSALGASVNRIVWGNTDRHRSALRSAAAALCGTKRHRTRTLTDRLECLTPTMEASCRWLESRTPARRSRDASRSTRRELGIFWSNGYDSSLLSFPEWSGMVAAMYASRSEEHTSELQSHSFISYD